MKLSYSKIRCFRTCQTEYWLSYILGIRRSEDADRFRIGTNWHDLQANVTPLSGTKQLVAVVKTLDKAYDVEHIPEHLMEKFAVEYRKLLHSYLAWSEYYRFSNTLYGINIPPEQRIGVKYPPTLDLVGVIDLIPEDETGKLWVREYKTTSEDIADGSDYWKNVQRDIQTPIYVILARAAGYDVQGVQYDVFRKPQIKPKKPVKKDYDHVDKVPVYLGKAMQPEDFSAELETPVMFGIRLQKHIMEKPEYYFARKEIPCTQADIDRAWRTVQNTAKQIKYVTDNDLWVDDPCRCLEYGKCQYWSICSCNVNPEKDLPIGFERKIKCPHPKQ